MKYLIPVFGLLLTLTACEGGSNTQNAAPVTANAGESPRSNPSSPTADATTETEAFDDMIFGHAFGMCQGETCVETYQLNETTLYEDSVDDYSHKSFNFSQLDNATFNKVKDLLNKIPAALWNTKAGSVGCPDCADGGGVYVQLTKDGVTKSWFIDNNLSNVPENLRGFVNDVNAAITLINQP